MDLNDINKYFSNCILSLQLFPLIGSTEKQQRVYLRQQLVQTLKQLKTYDSKLSHFPADEIDSLEDLNIAPYKKFPFISISHQGDYGGFLIAEKGCLVGFDIEDKERVTEKSAHRVCSKSTEKQLASLSPGDFWVLKEACFKSLSTYFDLNLLSEIEILDFQALEGKNFGFDNIVAKGQKLQGVKGVSFEQDRFKMGIVIKKDLTLV